MEHANAVSLPSKEQSSHSQKAGSVLIDGFSLVEGGPIYSFQLAIHLAMPDRSGVVKRALLAAAAAWLPMMLLALLQHRAFAPDITMPFLYDIGTAVRFLVGLPLLVVAEAVIDPKLNSAVRHFVTSGLISNSDIPTFESVIARTNKLRDSAVPAILILLAAFLPAYFHQHGELLRKGITSWHTIQSSTGEHSTLADIWFSLVALPLYRVLLFRWLWMTILWTVFLRRVMSLRLCCLSTHPDACGGLGFISDAQLFLASLLSLPLP